VPADRTRRLAIIGIMLVIVACLGVATWFKDSDKPAQSDPGVHISLGAMQYSFTGATAVKRTDTTITGLQSFLEHYGQKDIDLGCSSTYYNVIAYTKDESQILLNYGCDYPNARMFGIRDGDSWKLISPTNHFDLFGVPECAYLAEYSISREIAPVCVGQPMTNSDYQVR
jgi:hypothetical protein